MIRDDKSHDSGRASLDGAGSPGADDLAVAAWLERAALGVDGFEAFVAAVYRAVGRPETGAGSFVAAREAFGSGPAGAGPPLRAAAGPSMPQLSELDAARLLSRCPRERRRRSGRGGHGGVVYTPPSIASALAAALAGGPSAVKGPILDPAAGQGALLLALLAVVEGPERAATAARMEAFEVDERSVRILRHGLDLCGAGTPEEIAARVRRHDPLTDPSSPPDEPGRFGLIVTNPPWVSFSGRHRDRSTGVSPASLRERFESCGVGAWPSLHGAFLERCAELLDPQGTLLALVPAAMLELEGYGPARRAVSRRLGPPTLARSLGEDAFPGVRIPAALLAFQGEPGPRRRASERPWPPAPDEASRALVAALAGRETFASEVFGDPGVHTGNAAKLVLTTAEEGTPVYEGRCVRAFHLSAPVRGLRLDAALPEGRRWRFGALERYEGVPILIRQTAARPIAARHEPRRHFRNSVLACFGDPELSTEVLLAILNSELIATLHRARHGDARQRTFPQVKVGHLRSLPRPDPARLQLADLRRDAGPGRSAARGAGIETLGEALTRLVRELEARAELPSLESCDGAVSGAGDVEWLRAAIESRVRRLYELDSSPL